VRRDRVSNHGGTRPAPRRKSGAGPRRYPRALRERNEALRFARLATKLPEMVAASRRAAEGARLVSQALSRLAVATADLVS